MMQPRVVVTFFNDAHTFHAFHAFSTLFRCPKRSINDAHLEIYPRHYEISTQHPRVPIASLSTLDGRATRPQTNACARASSFASARTNERTNERTNDRSIVSLYLPSRAVKSPAASSHARARGPEDGRALQFPSASDSALAERDRAVEVVRGRPRDRATRAGTRSRVRREEKKKLVLFSRGRGAPRAGFVESRARGASRHGNHSSPTTGWKARRSNTRVWVTSSCGFGLGVNVGAKRQRGGTDGER